MNNENVCLNFAVNQSANIFYIKCDIPKLKGDNYKVWKERIFLHLGQMNIDYANSKNEPSGIIETSIPDVVDLYEKQERSNRLFVMFIKNNISASIHIFVDQHEKVNDLFKAINDQFFTSVKALSTSL